jgi:hypothetical protein
MMVEMSAASSSADPTTSATGVSSNVMRGARSSAPAA